METGRALWLAQQWAQAHRRAPGRVPGQASEGVKIEEDQEDFMEAEAESQLRLRLSKHVN